MHPRDSIAHRRVLSRNLSAFFSQRCKDRHRSGAGPIHHRPSPKSEMYRLTRRRDLLSEREGGPSNLSPRSKKLFRTFQNFCVCPLPPPRHCCVAFKRRFASNYLHTHTGEGRDAAFITRGGSFAIPSSSSSQLPFMRSPPSMRP